jgi:DNA polymerase-3 subunit epsilon
MRQVILDTETTGLEVQRGHRVIEIGCVELVQRRRTGREFHTYLNPDREIDEGARAVTGIADEFLLDKPRFAEIAAEFLEFVDGAEIIAHNASFDVGFLDAELARAGIENPRLGARAQVLDTLVLAREKYPGQRNSLDALCKRYDVDNSHRELHGALLDAQILLDVYLAMTGGQTALILGEVAEININVSHELTATARPHGVLRVVRASDDELAAHERILAVIDKISGGKTVWRKDAISAARSVDSRELREHALVPVPA